MKHETKPIMLINPAAQNNRSVGASITKHKIAFIGTGQFAVPIFEKLVLHPMFDVLGVITAPDKPSGRKRKLTPPPVKQLALKHKLPLFQPQDIAAVYNKLKRMRPDLIVLAAYGLIIPKHILSLPRFGCLNLHPSFLPKYRGASPVQTAILNGDKTTGITIILMDEKMDHGPVIARAKLTIGKKDNAQSLEQKLAEKAAALLLKTLPDYIRGKIKPESQKHSQASYTKKLTRQDGKIDWRESAQKIERKVRAFYPWPGTWTYLNKHRVKILRAEASRKKQRNALAAGQGFLILKLVQPAGKKPMTGQQYFRGHPNKTSD